MDAVTVDPSPLARLLIDGHLIVLITCTPLGGKSEKEGSE